MTLTTLFSTQDADSVRKVCQSCGPTTVSSVRLGGREEDVVRSRVRQE